MGLIFYGEPYDLCPPKFYRKHTQCRELQDPARELQGQVRTKLPERIRELPDQVRIDPDRAPKSFVGRFLAQLGRTTADSRLHPKVS